MTTLVVVDNLRLAVRGKVICKVDHLTVEAGDCLAVLGANGSGKTTLLRVLSGLEKVYAGAVLWPSLNRDRPKVVYVHQAPFLFRGSVLANVHVGTLGRKGTTKDRKDAARRWLARLGIESLANQSTRNLSGGERRKVALARGLAAKPDLLLLDEPFADIDPEGQEVISDVIAALSCTVVIASPVPLPVGLCDAAHQIHTGFGTIPDSVAGQNRG